MSRKDYQMFKFLYRKMIVSSLFRNIERQGYIRTRFIGVVIGDVQIGVTLWSK